MDQFNSQLVELGEEFVHKLDNIRSVMKVLECLAKEQAQTIVDSGRKKINEEQGKLATRQKYFEDERKEFEGKRAIEEAKWKNKDKMLQEREEELKNRENALHESEEQVNAQHVNLKELSKQVKDRKENVLTRESSVKAREAKLLENEAKMAKFEANLFEKEEKMEAELDSKLSEKEKELEKANLKTKMALRLREDTVKNEEAKYQTKLAEVAELEAKLAAREVDLSRRTQELDDREAMANLRDEELRLNQAKTSKQNASEEVLEMQEISKFVSNLVMVESSDEMIKATGRLLKLVKIICRDSRVYIKKCSALFGTVVFVMYVQQGLRHAPVPAPYMTVTGANDLDGLNQLTVQLLAKYKKFQVTPTPSEISHRI